MAKFKYFADINGQTFELSHVSHDGHSSTKAHHFLGFLPGTDMNTARRSDRVNATRAIEYKAFPSKHKCDARCTSAKGFRCECECGGKNHGAGNFDCVAA